MDAWILLGTIGLDKLYLYKGYEAFHEEMVCPIVHGDLKILEAWHHTFMRVMRHFMGDGLSNGDSKLDDSCMTIPLGATWGSLTGLWTIFK